MTDDLRSVILDGRTSLGIELGSTRIKLCLVDQDSAAVIAVGSHEWENQLVDRLWTYSLEAVWAGIQDAYVQLVREIEAGHGVRPVGYGAIGVSAMMHGYLVFDEEDELLVPFRTWRNTNTGPAAAELTGLFEANIPLRWSISHLHQAVIDAEPHIPRASFLTTLAGYVHWQLTGHKVIGVGDASGMFPIDSSTKDYDAELLGRYDGLIAERAPGLHLVELLPEVLVAGEPAGSLSAAGAALLDPTGALKHGAVLCPPEGDAGTGMVATRSVAPRTGNVSAGTSIFAMVVLEGPLVGLHQEIDLVTTPAGDPVAMVHCNNGASELGAWVGLFERFAAASGLPADTDAVFSTLFTESLEGAPDAGGLLAYNQLSGEPIAGLAEGRPLVVRTPESRFTLGNFMRSQLYGVFATLALGMRVLSDEGVTLDQMFAHGGLFRTAGVAQRYLAAAIGAPVSLADTASEGGAWGVAVLASFTASRTDSGSDGGPRDLNGYLRERVFSGAEFVTVEPDDADASGFATYLEHYSAGLAIEQAAVTALPS